MEKKTKILKFVPFVSCIEPGFWYKLRDLKLNELALNESSLSIKVYYNNNTAEGVQACINVDHDALDSVTQNKGKQVKVKGNLVVYNNVEALLTLDHNIAAQNVARQLWTKIKDKSIFSDPSQLLEYHLHAFADLKKFIFHYTAFHPALTTSHKFSHEVSDITHVFDQKQIEEIRTQIGIFSNNNNDHVFVLLLSEDGVVAESFGRLLQPIEEGTRVITVLRDSSSLPQHPGWSLRNVLLTLSYHCKEELKGRAEVLCWRERYKGGECSVQHSILITVELCGVVDDDEPKGVGWEKSAKGQEVSSVDLSSAMDPIKLSESASDLNLKLMKWRLVPDLDIDVLAQSSFLLLGAGTLSCNVARCLLGWGVKKITFVDNSKVSFSNPPRQSLYNYQDCLWAAHKAEAAAENLKKILPSVEARGVVLKIPMPGHALTKTALEDMKHLEELIRCHDVIMLLTDSRESRWMPSVVGRKEGKIVLSVALGFDTYLVIRHACGFPGNNENNNINISNNNDNNNKNNKNNNDNYVAGDELGCYFCNDVTSPGNSTANRTLDQQCTVTRPGVSMLASSLAVEVVASLLNHPMKGKAPAILKAHTSSQLDQCCLGIIPHQIRGFLSHYETMLPTCKSFHQCIACSATVIDSYTRDGCDFIAKVCEDPALLEILTGLNELHVGAKEIMDFPYGSDEDFE